MGAGRPTEPHGQRDDFLIDLVDAADKSGRTGTSLAGEMGISRTTYVNMRHGKNPTWETIRLLLDTLNLDVRIVPK